MDLISINLGLDPLPGLFMAINLSLPILRKFETVTLSRWGEPAIVLII